MSKKLKELGVTVYRPGQLDDVMIHYGDSVQKGLLLLYPRDPIVVIGNNIIELSLKVPFRAKERWGARKAFQAYLKEIGDVKYNYVSMPFPDPDYGDDNCYLEGGDVLINGRNIYVGISGNASNMAGVEWLQNYLGKKYKVHPIVISKKFQHLDCVMSLPRKGVMIACLDAIDFSSLPRHLQKWDMINVSVEDATKLACNFMIIDNKTLIAKEGFPHITDEIELRGIEVIEVPFDGVTVWDGGFRCNHHPLLRGK